MFSAIYKEYKIEITNVETYKPGSSDNEERYDFIYNDIADISYEATSKHGVKVYKEGLYKSAILLATGGATGVLSDSALIDNDNLITRCCNKVFSLSLPELELNWITEADVATCFSIHQHNDCYIIHGELFIAKLSKEGALIWQVGARDIFVNIDHRGDVFQLHDDHIELMDWGGHRYKLDYNGNISDDTINPFGVQIGK